MECENLALPRLPIAMPIARISRVVGVGGKIDPLLTFARTAINVMP
jgi:hypothetical protein